MANLAKLERSKKRRVLQRPALAISEVQTSPLQDMVQGHSSEAMPPPSTKPKTYSKVYSTDRPYEEYTPDEEPVPETAISCDDSDGGDFVMFTSPRKIKTKHILDNDNCVNAGIFNNVALSITGNFILNAMDKGWIIGRNLSQWAFHRCDNATITKSVYVDDHTGLFTVEINGKALTNLLVDNLPEYVASEASLMDLLRTTQEVKICAGLCDASESRLKEMAQGTHSAKCMTLVSDTARRCAPCRSARKVIVNCLLRRQKGLHTSRITTMSKESLVSLVRKQQYKQSLIKRQLTRARQKFSKVIVPHIHGQYRE